MLLFFLLWFLAFPSLNIMNSRVCIYSVFSLVLGFFLTLIASYLWPVRPFSQWFLCPLTMSLLELDNFLFSGSREYHRQYIFGSGIFHFSKKPLFLLVGLVLGVFIVLILKFSLSFPPLLAFCPYHIGHFSLVGLGFEEHVSMILLQT